MRQLNGGRRITRDQYDAVLFDLDRVITDTAKIHAACWEQMFDEYGRRPPGQHAVCHNMTQKMRRERTTAPRRLATGIGV
jgi:beta-phosphoglucomutase-like phosphatase (HAD superfamily)